MDGTDLPLKFTRVMEVGRDVPIRDGLVIRVTILDARTVKVEGQEGGGCGRKLRAERVKVRRKRARKYD